MRRSKNARGMLYWQTHLPNGFCLRLGCFICLVVGEEFAIIRVKLDIETGFGCEQKHHSRLWNWHRSFLKCDYVSSPMKKENCDSKMLWFDQGLWYMMTHLDIFFEEVEGLATKFMAFIHFLWSKLGSRFWTTSPLSSFMS